VPPTRRHLRECKEEKNQRWVVFIPKSVGGATTNWGTEEHFKTKVHEKVESLSATSTWLVPVENKLLSSELSDKIGPNYAYIAIGMRGSGNNWTWPNEVVRIGWKIEDIKYQMVSHPGFTEYKVTSYKAFLSLEQFLEGDFKMPNVPLDTGILTQLPTLKK
jgi:hypothetical protein